MAYKRNMGRQYDASERYVGETLNEAQSAVSNKSEEVKVYTIETYKQYVKESNAAPRTKDAMDEVIEYWDNKWK